MDGEWNKGTMMRLGIRGNPLPECVEDFNSATRLMKHVSCRKCGEQFNADNTHTSAGWAETQISGYCENCFDAMFPAEEDQDCTAAR